MLMFLSASQQTEVKNIARKLSIKSNSNDTVEYLAFKCILALVTKLESLEKDVKRLKREEK